MSDIVEKFAVFGGVNWSGLDVSKPTAELVEKLVLPDFKFIRNDVTEVTEGMPLYHSILSGVAQGDGQMHTAFKRANVSAEVGQKAVNELIEKGIIKKSKANKLYFTSPFLRFWFAFVSPIFKGIRDGDYSEFHKLFANKESEFVQLSFIELSHALLKERLKDEVIMELGEYVKDGVAFDIYAKTKSGKVMAGVCKYTNAKLKKSELTRLQEDCQKAGLAIDTFVLVAKNGFSNELKSLKGENLKLLTLKNFKSLVE